MEFPFSINHSVFLNLLNLNEVLHYFVIPTIIPYLKLPVYCTLFSVSLTLYKNIMCTFVLKQSKFSVVESYKINTSRNHILLNFFNRTCVWWKPTDSSMVHLSWYYNMTYVNKTNIVLAFLFVNINFIILYEKKT